jgi:hypothetical protein
MWPTSPAGFSLEATANLAPLPVWTTNSTVPVIIGGQNVVTNPMSGAGQFFRLSSQ